MDREAQGTPSSSLRADADRALPLAYALAGFIFVLGHFLPPAVSSDVLYILPVLMSLWRGNVHSPLRMAAACTLLSLVAIFEPGEAGAQWLVALWRPDVELDTAALTLVLATSALSIFALWVTAKLGANHIQGQRELEASRAELDVTLRGIADGVLCADDQGRVRFLNPAAQALCGWSLEQARGKPLDEVLVLEPWSPAGGPRRLWGTQLELESLGALEVDAQLGPLDAALAAGRAWLLRRDGSRLPIELTRAPLQPSHMGESAALRGQVLVLRDRSLALAAEEVIRARAYRDELTGLPNRAALLERLELELAHARRKREPLAVLYLDLDGLKSVNDRYGHRAGDELLRGCAERMRTLVRAADTVARLGGDEFTVLLPGIGGPHETALVAQKLLHGLEQGIDCAAHRIRAGVSIGIALYPQDGETPQALLTAADQAMYQSKRQGGQLVTFAQTEDAAAPAEAAAREERSGEPS